jgi:hypothetical protein
LINSRLLGYATIEKAVVSVLSVPRSSGNSGVMQPAAKHGLRKYVSTFNQQIMPALWQYSVKSRNVNVLFINAEILTEPGVYVYLT